MPKINYDNAVVFAIRCVLNDDMFVTSSTGDLVKAFIRIKNKMKKANHHVYQTMAKNGVHNYYIDVLERIVDCQRKFDIQAVEAKYIKLLKPNLNIPPALSTIPESDSSSSLNENDSGTVPEPDNTIQPEDEIPEPVKPGQCFYSDLNLNKTCSGTANCEVRMNRKKSKPRMRNVCFNCSNFLVSQEKATVMHGNV